MINLLFDLNNLVYRSLFIISGYGSKTMTFDSQNEIDQLIRKISIDISSIIRLINPSRVIFTKDDRSWRKEIKIEENDGYKAQRIKSTNINWNNIYSALEEFCKIAENNGITVSGISTAESDDLLTLWADEIQHKQHQHAIIVSGDEDMRQLVSFWPYESGKIAYTTVYNPFMQGKNSSRKLYVPQHFEDWINTADAVDFMNLKGTINVDKEDFRKIINAEKTKMEVVNGRMIMLRKIFCGDDGDNIPAIHTWLNEKDVEVRITNSKFEKIYEGIKIESDELMDHDTLWERRNDVMKLIKAVSKTKPTFKIDDRLRRQIKLVVLSPDVFPEEIINKFNEVKQKELDKPRVNYSSLNMKDLLEGTRYISEKKNENEASIFKQIDRISGTALF